MSKQEEHIKKEKCKCGKKAQVQAVLASWIRYACKCGEKWDVDASK